MEVFNYPIVYSTNSNFEFVYLNSMYRANPVRTRPYDVVIVDEVDNMFLDQARSPAMISKPISVKHADKIFKTVYLLRNHDIDAIIQGLQKMLPRYGEFDREGITMLKEAALVSDMLYLGENYIIEDTKEGQEIVIIDDSTSYTKRGSHWNKFIHEMVEIKHGLKMKNPSVSFCAISQKSYFSKYQRIGGVTGTIGSKSDENMLKNAYGINLFKVLKNRMSEKPIVYRANPGNEDDLFDMINLEIKEIVAKGRPVLVIFNSINEVERFCSKYGFSKEQTIQGTTPDADRNALKNAGKPGVVTIATNAAGRGTDIILNPLTPGGLHVIIAHCPKNERILEQAIGRSGRQGQPGSALIYILENDRFYPTLKFNRGYENIVTIELRFANYVKEHCGWLYAKPKKYALGDTEYRFKANSEEVLKTTAQKIAGLFAIHDMTNMSSLKHYHYEIPEEDQHKASDCILDMILTAWGTFFTDISQHVEEYEDFNKCNRAYHTFLLELDEWIPENCDSVTKAVTNILAKAPPKSLSQNLDDVFDEYHNAVCSIESSGNAFLDTLMGIGIGAMDTAFGLCEGTKQIVDHPLQTALNLAMLMHPIYQQQFLRQATQQFKNFAQTDIIDGDPLTRSKGISRVACEIGLLAAPFLKASGVSKCAEGAKIAETASEIAKGAEVIKDVEVAEDIAKASRGYKIDLQLFGRGAERAGKTISEETLEWLKKGDPDTSVYFGVQKGGEPVYTGITKQELAKRLYQHNYNGKEFFELAEQVDKLTKNQARAVEQYLIENGTANAMNKINSISPSSKYYSEAMQWAEHFVKNPR